MKIKEKIMNEKLNYKGEKKEISKFLQEVKKRDEDDDLGNKKNKKYQILSEKNMHLTKKIQSIEDHHQTLKNKYTSKVVEKHMKQDENLDKIRKLEEMESQLIERLKHTHINQ